MKLIVDTAGCMVVGSLLVVIAMTLKLFGVDTSWKSTAQELRGLWTNRDA